jgi:hypothetical protein
MIWHIDLSGPPAITQALGMFTYDPPYNPGITAFLTVAITFMLLMIQRSEAKKRLVVLLAVLVAFELIRRYIWFRDVHSEGWTAIGISVFLNLAYYLFIGRYNPVTPSDSIQVIGMDD